MYLHLVAIDGICIWAAFAGKRNLTVTRNFYLQLLVITELLLGITSILNIDYLVVPTRHTQSNISIYTISVKTKLFNWPNIINY